MAMATGPGSRTIENQWTCALLASPNRVQSGGDVTFSVKLSNPGIAQLFSGSNGTIDSIPNIPGGQISAFYECLIISTIPAILSCQFLLQIRQKCGINNRP